MQKNPVLSQAVKSYFDQNYDRAVEKFRLYLSTNPETEDAEIHFLYANSIYQKINSRISVRSTYHNEEIQQQFLQVKVCVQDQGQQEEQQILHKQLQKSIQHALKLKLDPKYWQFYGYYCFQTQRFDLIKKSQRLIQAAIQLNNDLQKVQQLKQFLLCIHNQIEKTKQYIKNIAEQVQSVEGYSQYAQLLFTLQQYKQSQKYCLKALSIDEKHCQSLLIYARCIGGLYDRSKARQVFYDAIKNYPKTQLFYSSLIQTLTIDQEILKICQIAQENLEDQIKQDCIGAYIFDKHYQILRKNKKLAQANNLINKFRNTSKNYSHFEVTQSLIELFQRNFLKSRQHILKAIELDPRNSNAHTNYGIILNQLKENDKGRQQLKKGFYQFRSSMMSGLAYAQFLRIEDKNYQRSQQILKFLIKFHEIDSRIYHQYAWLLCNMGKIQEATMYFKKAFSEGDFFSRKIAFVNQTILFCMIYKKIDLLKLCFQHYKELSSQADKDQWIGVKYIHGKNLETIQNCFQVFRQLSPQSQQIIEQLFKNKRVKCRIQQVIEITNKIWNKQDRMEHNLLQQTLINCKNTEKINKIQKKLMKGQWRQKYDNIIQQLSKRDKLKQQKYGINLANKLFSTLMYFKNKEHTLAQQIHTQKGKIGSTIKKFQPITKILEIVKKIGAYAMNMFIPKTNVQVGNNQAGFRFENVENILDIIFKANDNLLNLQHDIISKKIINVCQNLLFPQSLLEQQISRAVVYLLEDKEHIQILQAEDEQPWFLFQKIQHLMKKKQQFENRFFGIKGLAQEQKKACTDCSMIFQCLISCQKMDNPILQSAKIILKQKKQKLNEQKGSKRRHMNPQTHNNMKQ